MKKQDACTEMKAIQSWFAPYRAFFGLELPSASIHRSLETVFDRSYAG